MSAIQPTDNTGLIVDEFISYATNHLNSIKGTIYTTSLYPPVGTPNIGVLNWTGYFISPSTKSNVVTQDDFKPKQDVEEHQSVRPTKEETLENGLTEEELEEFLKGPEIGGVDSGDVVTAFQFSTGKPFVSGFRSGGGGFRGGGTGGPVDLGDLDLSAPWLALAAKFIGKNEGFTDVATWDVNAYRLGFGSDKILGTDGKVRDVYPPASYYRETGDKKPANGDRTTVEAALKMLEYELAGPYKNRLVGTGDRKISEATFEALNNKQKAALISYVYNVGSLRPGIAAAIRAGQLSSAVTQIQAGPVTPEQYRIGLQRRRNEEASLFST
jgi:GH24 family phage-related lysozyme (muramidase)